MEIQYITSAQNPLVKKIAKLSTSAKARREENLAILDGQHLCLEWSGEFEYLFVTENFTNRSSFKSRNLVEVPDAIMAKIAPTKSPSGILGVIRSPGSAIQNSTQDPGFVLLLEAVQDPGNIGTIIRTAAATGVDTIYLSPECADAWSPKALRAGMGGHFKLQLVENVDLLSIKDHFDGPLCSTLMSGKNLFEIALPKKVGFVMGNEGAGVSKELNNICDQHVSIPMQNNVESLNVATAAGLCSYEYVRQWNN